MSQTLNAAIAVIGIDIGKNSFHIVGHDVAPLCCARNGHAGALHRGFRTCRRVALGSKQEWRHTMLLASLPRLAMM